MNSQYADIDKIETLIYLEALMDVGFQALAGVVHNSMVRKECQEFEQRVQYRRDELKKGVSAFAGQRGDD